MGRTRLLLAVAAVALLLGLAACGDGDDPAEATPTTFVERRTDIPEVNAVLDAVEAGDIEHIKSLLRYTPMPCGSTNAFVVCDPGEAEGTLQDVLAIAACKEGLMTRERIARSFLPEPISRTVYGVYPAPASSGELWDPPADYIAVFSSTDPGRELFATAIEQGAIVKLLYGVNLNQPPYTCAGVPVELVRALSLEDPILPPLEQ